MQYLTLLASASAFAVSVIATESPTTTTNYGLLPPGYTWEVEGWHAGCVPGSCSYNFNVTGPDNGYLPCFKAHCFGQNTGYFQPCDILFGNETGVENIPFVSASLKPSTSFDADISVSLQFIDAPTQITHNITGQHIASYNAGAAPLEDFTIVPDNVVQLGAPVTFPPPSRQS